MLLLSQDLYEESHYLLDRLLRRAGFTRDHFYFAQANRPEWQAEAVARGVKVVVPLGERALRAVVGEPGIRRWRGRVVEPGLAPYLAVPTYRPSRLLHRRSPPGVVDPEQLLNPPRYQREWLRDLHYAVHVAQHGFTRTPVSYLLDPSPEKFAQWVREFEAEAAHDPDTLLSFDIETPYKQEIVDEDELEEGEAASDLNTQILRISFSYRPNTAVTVPWLPQYHDGVKTLLAHPGGKVGWNCPLPDERVLTADLRWKRAGDLQVGDQLVGFDADLPGPRQRRGFKAAVVEHVGRHHAQAYGVRFSDGAYVEVSAEHPWLSSNIGGNGANYRWRRTNDLKPGMRVPRFFVPWEADESYEAGWLAGMVDGDGSLTKLGPRRPTSRRRYGVSIAQKQGPTWERLKAVTAALGYNAYTSHATKNPDSKNRFQCSLRIAAADVPRFLGRVRPSRLLGKFRPEQLGALQASASAGRDTFVTEVVDLGVREIVELSTSTRTYVLEGFGAHNSLYFDVPVLEANGFPINGALFDGMDAWHFLYPQADKGLEAVSAEATDVLPWKHLSDAQPEWYSAADADVALRNVLYTFDRLHKQGSWESYLENAVEAMIYLGEAGKNGTPLDTAKQAELVPLLDAETLRLERLIQAAVPESLKPRKRYKRTPEVEVAEGWTDQRMVTRDGRVFTPVAAVAPLPTCSVCGEQGITKAAHFKGGVEEVTETRTSKKGVTTTKVKRRRVPNACKVAGATLTKSPAAVVEWDEILPFNANSSSQLVAYMKAHKHPVGRNKKDPDRESADAQHLELLVEQYGDRFPLYDLALQLHKVRKARTTYMPVPDAEGLIHTTYTNTPWTWRLGSRALNLQNWGKRNSNKWAKMARLQIIARPGWRFVQADSSSAEAVLQGYYMGDPEYMAKAGQGIHAWLATKYLGWDFNPDTVEKVKAEHEDLYAGMKVANFCVTGDHEVLTQHGWVRFDQYDGQTPIAEWDPKGEAVRWTKPDGMTIAPYAGPMHHWEGQNFSAVMTPNHHLPVYYDSAQALPHYEAVKDIRETGRLPVTGELDGPDAPISDALLRLMVATQADGSISASQAIAFNFKKRRKITRMRELLAAHGVPCRETAAANGYTVFRLRQAESAPVVALLDEHKRFSLPLLLSLSLRQRRLVLEEVLHWDGSDNRARKSQTAYFTTSRPDAEAIHTVAKVSGVNSLLRCRRQTTPYGKLSLWTVSFNRARRTRVQTIEKTTQPFEGTVYCVTMPTQHFMMRHGTEVVVSANTLNFGGSAYAMHKANRKLFPSLARAEEIVDIIYELLPTLESYHYNIRALAHKQGYLVSPWKVKFHFYDVFTYDRDKRTGEIRYTKSGRPRLKLGKDGKAVVAALPQHSNGMFSRGNIVRIGRSEWRPYLPASFTVHDSYKLRVPTHLEEKAAEFLLSVLTRPIPELGGLRLGAEVEAGDNWASYDARTNPGGMKRIAKQEITTQSLAWMPDFGAEVQSLMRAA